MKNYYKVLGIGPDANKKEITEAYHNLLAHYDERIGAGDKYAEERYIDITVAYNTLINDDKRRDYDRILKSIISLPKERIFQKKVVEEEVELTAGDAPAIPIYYERNKLLNIKVYIPILLLGLILPVFLIKQYFDRAPESGYSSRGSDHSITNKEARPVFVGAQPVVEVAESASDKEAAPVKEAAVAETVPENVKPAGKVTPVTLQPVAESVSEVPTVKTEEPAIADNLGFYADGTSKDEVLKYQGTPKTIIRAGNNQEVWKYEHITVIFTNNQVVSSKLNQPPAE